jgi:hypothetical protein
MDEATIVSLFHRYSGQNFIAVSYFGQPISGSPFTSHVWNAAAVTVSGVKAGCIGRQSIFNGSVSIHCNNYDVWFFLIYRI